jgi:hypothetical protein
MSIRLSECISAALTGRIAIKFDVGGIFMKICRKSPNLIYSPTKILGTLREDPSVGCCFGRCDVTIKPLLYNTALLAVTCSSTIHRTHCWVSTAPHWYVIRTFWLSCSGLDVVPLEPVAETRLINRQTFVLGHSRGLHLIRPFCISFLHPCVWAHRQMRGNYRKIAVCALVQICTSEIQQSVIQGDLNGVSTASFYYSQVDWAGFGFFKLRGRLGVHQGIVFWNNSLSIRQTDRQRFFFTFVWPCIVTHFLLIKPTRWTNFSNLFLKWNSYMFRTVPLSIIRSYSLYTQRW